MTTARPRQPRSQPQQEAGQAARGPQTSYMSDREQTSDFSIRNPETRSRRAWVERALQGVRERLASGELQPGPGDTPGAPPKPRLSVVPSGRKR